jgi:hypothetical protein
MCRSSFEILLQEITKTYFDAKQCKFDIPKQGWAGKYGEEQTTS